MEYNRVCYGIQQSRVFNKFITIRSCMQQRLRCNNIDLTIQNIHNNGIGENTGIQCIYTSGFHLEILSSVT